jgi:YD repeat-containing protein
MRKNKILLLLILSLSSVKISSQVDFGHVTPQTADFIKYGEIPVSLFTGKMNLEIPIYHIKDNDFDIPISLIYTSDGFKPEKRSDLVGLDWTLKAGGCITREVYGAADESRANSIYGQEMGYLLTVKQNSSKYDKDKVWNFDPGVVLTNNTLKYYYIEYDNSYFADYQPDLFMFNFNGHTGQFMINSDGTAISNDKRYKIDISGLTTQYTYEVIMPDTSTIKITTPEGYIYEFGGRLNNLEFSISFTNGTQWAVGTSCSVILAWHLSKITAPNGRMVKFNYLEEMLANHSHSKTSPIWQSGKAEKVKNTVNTYAGHATKKVILESIEVDNVKVEFKKSVETTLVTNGLYNDMFFTEHSDFNHATYQLDSVYVKYSNTTLYKYKLNYENKDKRRFLTSVIQPDNSKYEFRYNDDTTYPSPSLQPGTDTYGYWKSNNSTNSYGLLSRVDYPTGGHSGFEYEPHQYRYAVELNLSTLNKSLVSSSNQTEIVLSSSGAGGTFQSEDGTQIRLPLPHANNNTTSYFIYNLGGARIKKVSHYSDDTKKETEKEYFYNETINGNQSSGILYQARPYQTTKTGAKTYIIENTWNKNYNIEETPIGYSSVFEKNLDGSYCRYKFSNYTNNPDNDTDTKEKVYPNTNIVDNNLDLIFSSINRVVSNSDRRGFLMEKQNYNSNGNEASYEWSEYKAVSSGLRTPSNPYSSEVYPSTDYVVSFKSIVPGGCIVKKIYLRNHPLIYKRERIDNVVREECYRYNNYDLLQTKSIILKSADTLKVNYSYPSDYTTAIYTEMVSKNRLSPVIEQVTTQKQGTVSKEIERIKTDYIKDATRTKNLILPDKISSSHSGADDLRTDITYNLYDAKGNILQYTRSDGVPTACLWGYNYQKPVAKIENATFEQVKTAVGGQTVVDRIANADSPSNADSITIYNLRTNTNLPNFNLVTTYMYKPMVGLQTIIDPRGVKTTYHYDPFGRLQAIKDENNKTIENYEYRYKN